MIKILVNGAHGKMGQRVVKAVEADAELALVGQADRNDDLAAKIKETSAEVVVDFTAASVGFQNAEAIIEAGAHPVIGTTGFTQDQIAKLQDRCAKAKLGGIIAPNFSMGAVLMMRFAQEAAEHFNHAEIIELHHNRKEDAPSGTAIRTAQLIAEKTKLCAKESKETLKGARGANSDDVHIHSVRLPGLVAHQEVIFGGTGETLTIRHDSIDRECFMPGVLLACKKVQGLQTLVYGLEAVL